MVLNMILTARLKVTARGVFFEEIFQFPGVCRGIEYLFYSSPGITAQPKSQFPIRKKPEDSGGEVCNVAGSNYKTRDTINGGVAQSSVLGNYRRLPHGH